MLDAYSKRYLALSITWGERVAVHSKYTQLKFTKSLQGPQFQNGLGRDAL